jgi:hypothetical protein
MVDILTGSRWGGGTPLPHTACRSPGTRVTRFNRFPSADGLVSEICSDILTGAASSDRIVAVALESHSVRSRDLSSSCLLLQAARSISGRRFHQEAVGPPVWEGQPPRIYLGNRNDTPTFCGRSRARYIDSVYRLDSKRYSMFRTAAQRSGSFRQLRSVFTLCAGRWSPIPPHPVDRSASGDGEGSVAGPVGGGEVERFPDSA